MEKYIIDLLDGPWVKKIFMEQHAILASAGAIGYLYFSVATLMKIGGVPKHAWKTIGLMLGIGIVSFLIIGMGVVAENKICLGIVSNYNDPEMGLWMLLVFVLSLTGFFNCILKKIPLLICIPMSWIFLSICFLAGNPCSPYCVPPGGIDGILNHNYDGSCSIFTGLLGYGIIDSAYKIIILIVSMGWSKE